MRDMTLVFLYMPFALALLGIIIFVLMQDFHKRMTPSTVLLTSSILVWYLIVIQYNLAIDPDLSAFLYDLNMPFVAFSSLGALLFVLDYFGLDTYRPPLVVFMLVITPLITLVLMLTTSYHEFMRVDLEIVSTYPVHIAQSTRGPWYWVHTLYCYALLLATVLIAAVQYRGTPVFYRSSVRYLLIGLCIAVACNVLTITGRIQTRVDLGLIGGSIFVLFAYRSTRKHQGVDLLNFAKTEIFNELDDAILIMDTEGVVINRNLAAKYLLYRLGGEVDEPSYDVIMQKAGKNSIEEPRSNDSFIGIDYAFMENGRRRIYNLSEKQLYDNRGMPLGVQAVFRDVTDNRTLAKQLEEEAGRDAMTGLMNRGRLREAMRALDDGSNLPLTVVSCELTGLKKVNDQHGHEQGDRVLCAAADAMSACCPPRAAVARTGGDEFLIVIPDCIERQAFEIMGNVGRKLVEWVGGRYEVGLAMGIAAKTDPCRPLEQIIDNAEYRMRDDKRRHRPAGRE